MRVTFNELAERELNDAAHYYELEQPGLGSAFITDIQGCTEAIVAYPLAGTIVLGGIRRRLRQRFSNGLLYAVREGRPDMTSGPTSGCSRQRLPS